MGSQSQPWWSATSTLTAQPQANSTTTPIHPLTASAGRSLTSTRALRRPTGPTLLVDSVLAI